MQRSSASISFLFFTDLKISQTSEWSAGIFLISSIISTIVPVKSSSSKPSKALYSVKASFSLPKSPT